MTTETDDELSPQEDTTWFGVFNAECIVIVIINAFTIFAFARKCHLRKRATYLIINLTMADLLVGAVTLPLFIYYPKEIEPGHGFSWRKLICLTFRNVYPLTSQANLCLISLERLHATLYPFRHCLTQKWVYFRIIIGSWSIALLLSCVMAFLDLCVPEVFPYAWASYIVLTLLILTISYTIINYSVKGNPVPHNSGSVVSDRKLSVTLFIVTVVSTLTTLPKAIWLSIPEDIRRLSQLSYAATESVHFTLLGLYLANSMVNPVIYAIRMQEFRKAVKQFTCKRAREPRNVVHAQQENGEVKL